MQASLRRTNGSLLVYLDSSSEDIGILRRAIATTAQEIRGPVAVLCGVAESITQAGDEMSDSQRQRLMSSVTRQARMLDSITADLLTAAEIQRGTLHLDPQEVDPLSVIDAVISDRYLVTVSAQVEDDRQVTADPMRLEQMLSNLVGNALKYGRAPYVVRVEADPDGRRAGADRRHRLRRGRARGLPGPAVPRVQPAERRRRDGHRSRALRRALASPRRRTATVDYRPARPAAPSSRWRCLLCDTGWCGGLRSQWSQFRRRPLAGPSLP